MEHAAEFQNLWKIAKWKRDELAQAAQRRTKRWRLLSFLAGFLALLSAGSMTAIIAEVTTSLGLKLAAALLSLASGTITLLIANFYDEKDTRRIWDGAARFLSLRDQAHLLSTRKLGAREREETLENLHKQYADYSAQFDHYIDNLVARSRVALPVTISSIAKGPPPPFMPGSRPFA